MKLTQALCKMVPDWYHVQRQSTSYFKKQSLFFMTRYNKDIGWATHKNAMNRFQYKAKEENFFSPLRSQIKRDINLSRVQAACEEHGCNFGRFMSTLRKIDIAINSYSLARLAIYEPRSFKCLVDIALQVSEDISKPMPHGPLAAQCK